MRRYGIHFWKTLPFLRLLMALCAGIVAQRYLPTGIRYPTVAAILAAGLLTVIQARHHVFRFHWRWINGVLIHILFIASGAILQYKRDLQNDNRCITHYPDAVAVIALVTEAPVPKANSVRCLARAQWLWHEGKWQPATGNLLVYLAKDSVATLPYGTQVLVKKRLQPVSNSGNPGAFDYRQYCRTQDIFCQVFLRNADYRILGCNRGSAFTAWLQGLRDATLSVLRRYIPGEKETGVAEALLLGYRNDLDRDLVQAYSNTGVVHIIAISGLHLGMIYGLMLLLLKPLRRLRWLRWIKPLLLLSVLWGFCLLTGAAASILRSAVMFTFIIAGESLGRRTRVYNTLAASAFCLLAYNPWFLWDAGFLLSYGAILGILIFSKPVYRLIYCSNKLLDAVWQLNAITLSAQVFTLPLVLGYFHQFPNLFLFTNFIAVPLSGIILYAELLLLVFSLWPAIGNLTGMLISFLISRMNGIIERTGRLPFAVTDAIPFCFEQGVLLYVAIAFTSAWIFYRKRSLLLPAIAAVTGIAGIHALYVTRATRQQKLVVYHIPKQHAMECMSGRRSYLRSSLLPEEQARADIFHFRASRICYGLLPGYAVRLPFRTRALRVGQKSVLVIDKQPEGHTLKRRYVDIIVISGNARIKMAGLAKLFDCRQYVFDSSNPLWKIRHWKKEADSLHLRHYSVPEQGAFIMDF